MEDKEKNNTWRWMRKRARLWYEYEPESMVENQNLIMLWDFTKKCDHMIETRGSDIVVVDKVKKRQ